MRAGDPFMSAVAASLTAVQEPSPLPHPVANRIADLAHVIGNTPLLAVDLLFRGRPCVVYAKCEQMNLTGSIKDRMVLEVMRDAYATGALRGGETIAEATSGNAGISCAAIGRALGHPVTIFMPDWMSQERVQLLRCYGANVIPVSRAEGGFLGSIARCEQLARERSNVFLPKQFSNQANAAAHSRGTGPEIWSQLATCGLIPDAFVAGVGTGGTVMGVGRFLRARRPSVKIHPVEPAESPTLSTGTKVGSHRIAGISDDFIPAIIRFDELDEVLAVSDGDSILMAQRLSAELGLGVGISSGCNFIAALKAQERLGPGAVVVTVFCDDNKKYLSTDLLREEPVKSCYLSPEVKLLGLRTFARSH